MGWPIISSRYAQDAPLSTDLFTDIVGQLTTLTTSINGPQVTQGAPNVANGSFEIDPVNQVQPTGWTFTAGTGGSGLVTNTDQNDGAQCYKMVQNTTSGNTAGTLNSIDSNSGLGYMAVSPLLSYNLSFMLKCSRTDVQNKVVINWFNSSKASVSSTTVYDITQLPPTVWTTYQFLVTPPAGCYFATVTLMGGQNAVTPPGANCNIFFDGVFMTPFKPGQLAKTYTTGTNTFTVPSGVFNLNVEISAASVSIKNVQNPISYYKGMLPCVPGDLISVYVASSLPFLVNGWFALNTRTGQYVGTNPASIGLVGSFTSVTDISYLGPTIPVNFVRLVY